MLILLNTNLLNASRIQGYIYGFDGKPIKVSHIKFKPLNSIYDSPQFTILEQSDKNGFYSAELFDSIMYEIKVSGINHYSINFYFQPNYFKPTNNDSVFKINIKLGSNIFDKQKQISIIYDFKNYKYYPMEYMSDEKYHYILKEPIDTLKYEITNLLDNNHTSNGTLADTFLLDNEGDYYSVLYTKNKIPYDIILDPNLLPNVNSVPKLESNDKDIDYYLRMQLQIKKIFEHLLSVNPLNSNNSKNNSNDVSSKQFIDSIYKILGYFKKDFLSSNLLYRKKLFGVYYLYFNSFLFIYDNLKILGIKIYPVDIDTKFIKEILQVLTPFDDEWRIPDIQNGTMTTACFLVFNNLKNEYIDNLIFNTKDDDFKRNEVNQIISFLSEYHSDTELLKYYKQIYSSKYPNDYYSKEYLKILTGSSPFDVSKKIPLLKLSTLDGDTLDLEQTTGYYTLIDVWATWCGPCVKELPYIKHAYLKYKNEKLKIISISFDNDVNKVKTFQKNKIGMPWINCIETESFNSDFAKRFQISSIPKLILTDPEHNIIAIDDDLRNDNLYKILDKIFNKNQNSE